MNLLLYYPEYYAYNRGGANYEGKQMGCYEFSDYVDCAWKILPPAKII